MFEDLPTEELDATEEAAKPSEATPAKKTPSQVLLAWLGISTHPKFHEQMQVFRDDEVLQVSFPRDFFLKEPAAYSLLGDMKRAAVSGRHMAKFEPGKGLIIPLTRTPWPVEVIRVQTNTDTGKICGVARCPSVDDLMAWMDERLIKYPADKYEVTHELKQGNESALWYIQWTRLAEPKQ